MLLSDTEIAIYRRVCDSTSQDTKIGLRRVCLEEEEKCKLSQ